MEKREEEEKKRGADEGASERASNIMYMCKSQRK